jgi:chromosome segregation ATPase
MKMISQRDINAFFVVLDVLANPERAKSELKVLADMRASVDSDLEKAGIATQNAQNALTEARNIESAAKLALDKARETEEQNKADLAAIAAERESVSKIVMQNAEINRLLNAREQEIEQREKELIAKLSRYETSIADHNVRNEALRKKEADYRERMEKLRQISN